MQILTVYETEKEEYCMNIEELIKMNCQEEISKCSDEQIYVGLLRTAMEMSAKKHIKDGKIIEDINTDTEGIGSVAGFNSNTLNPANKNEGTQKQHYERVEQGNIGVTTTQQMITEEMELHKKFDMYHIIIDEFKFQFCLSVY